MLLDHGESTQPLLGVAAQNAGEGASGGTTITTDILAGRGNQRSNLPISYPAL